MSSVSSVSLSCAALFKRARRKLFTPDRDGVEQERPTVCNHGAPSVAKCSHGFYNVEAPICQERQHTAEVRKNALFRPVPLPYSASLKNLVFFQPSRPVTFSTARYHTAPRLPPSPRAENSTKCSPRSI